MEDNIIHIELDDEFIEENEVIEVPKEKTIEEVIEEKIVDKLEEKVAEIPIPKDGKDGPKGKDGKTPTKTEIKAIVKPLVPTAKEIAEIVLPKIPKPKDGEKGEDGKSFRFADLTAYEKQILTGPPGSTGVGVPRGGTVNQKLAKRTSKDFDTEWVDDNAGGTLGSITGTLTTSTTAVGNVGTGEDNLITYTVPGNLLTVNTDRIKFTAAGTFAANINNKRIRVYFGTTVLLDTTALALNGGDWVIYGEIIRTGAATQKAWCRFSSSNALLTSSVDYTTPAMTLSSNQTFKLTGEATSNNDISQEILTIDYCPSN